MYLMQTDGVQKRSRRTRTIGWVLLSLVFELVVVSMPSMAEACAVCTAGREDENALAFLLSTIGMSLMPLAAVGTLVLILWRRLKKLEADAASSIPSVPVEPR